MKRALLRYNDQLIRAQADSPWLDRFPLFIVIRDTRTVSEQETELASFAKFVPDVAGYYVTADGAKLDPRDFSGKSAPAQHAVRPVALLKLGDSIAVSPIEEQTPKVINFAAYSSDGLSALDSITHSFLPLAPVETVPAATRYAGGIAAWQDYLDLIYNPPRGNAGLAEIVKRSRQSGVMVGSTSFIVVENSA